MRSVQIHKTQLLFPSYIFFQRSITHRPWQPPLGRVHYRPVRQARMPTCPMPRIGSFSKYFPAKGEKLPGSRKEAGKVESIARCGGNCLRRKESRLFCDGDCWPGSPFPTHLLVTTVVSLLLATFWKTRRSSGAEGAFSTSPVSLGQRPANPASVLQCPPDRRGVRSGLFMDETPLKGTTGYLPPVSPPYNGHTAQLYTCYSMRGLHNTDTQYSESIQHGHVNSSHQ